MASAYYGVISFRIEDNFLKKASMRNKLLKKEWNTMKKSDNSENYKNYLNCRIFALSVFNYQKQVIFGRRRGHREIPKVY